MQTSRTSIGSTRGRHARIQALLVPALALGIACGEAPAGDGAGTGGASVRDSPAPAVGGGQNGLSSGAAGGTDTLMLEGSPQAVAVRRWSTPDEFPLPFSTILPERVRASTGTEGQLAWARFEFDGVPADRAWMRMLVLDDGLTRPEALSRARAVASDFGPIVSRGIEYTEGENAPDYEWAHQSWGLTGVVHDEPVTGSLSLGRHGERFFTIMQIYPPEYGDGVGPRFQYILEHLRWRDTGTRLRLEHAVPEFVDPPPE